MHSYSRVQYKYQIITLLQHYNNEPIHRLTPDMVKDYTDGMNVYLGCQQKATVSSYIHNQCEQLLFWCIC